MMIVARQRPKNANTTIITNNKAKKIVSANDAIVLRMLSDVSTITFNLTSLGRFFCRLGISAITLLEISTEFAPDCFCTMIIAPFLPLV